MLDVGMGSQEAEVRNQKNLSSRHPIILFSHHTPASLPLTPVPSHSLNYPLERRAGLGNSSWSPALRVVADSGTAFQRVSK
jgi:hypothetical protein